MKPLSALAYPFTQVKKIAIINLLILFGNIQKFKFMEKRKKYESIHIYSPIFKQAIDNYAELSKNRKQERLLTSKSSGNLYKC